MDAISVHDVVKTYRIGVGRARVREMLPWPVDSGLQRMFPRWWAKDTFNALDGVSLSVPMGSTYGIIGANGAGKTTLLKVIAGVTSPNSGSASTSGRVAALIDLVVGFHPELTGHENVFMLGAIYGFGRKAMLERLDRIFAFAEIDEMADTPIKRYSTGMVARLGFATLSVLDMDVLLIDEVLAVGDASFQRKCIRWLEGYRDGGGTLMFVSHNLALVRSMTEQVVWLDHGRVVEEGPTGDVLTRYAQAMEKRDQEATGRGKRRDVRRAMRARGMQRWGAGGVRVEEVHFDGPSEEKQLSISIDYGGDGVDTVVFQVGFIDEAGHELGGATSGTMELNNGGGTVDCRIPALPFRSGVYFPVISVLAPDGRVYDRWALDRAVVIEHPGEPGAGFGPVDIAGRWSRRSGEERVPTRGDE